MDHIYLNGRKYVYQNNKLFWTPTKKEIVLGSITVFVACPLLFWLLCAL